MLPEQASILTQQLTNIVRDLVSQDIAPVTLERPKVAAHGDIATNIALQTARKAGRNPRELAQDIVERVNSDPLLKPLIASAEIAGPGFINLRLSDTAVGAVLDNITEKGARYGWSEPTGERVLVEFVSANPTGPLHVGHARQAALGDSLCRLFEAAGREVSREFYYNDAGNQIDILALSVQARLNGILPDDPGYPSDGYRGDYIAEIARAYANGETVQASDSEPITGSGDPDDLDAIRRFAVTSLRHEQDLDLKAFDLTFDRYYLESSLYEDGSVDTIVKRLSDNGHTYEDGGALWLRTTELDTGDDKDRVMRKREGGYTYFVPDVAYHVNKWERGFTKAINIQGTDHHGTIARVRAGLQGLQMDIPADYPDYILHSMVRVMRDGEEVKISKRAGSYVTLRELIDWVGRDAVRFFLIQRRADTQFVFDIDLALSKSEENPVYYVQYAHARICSVLNQAGELLKTNLDKGDVTLLTAPTERALLKRLAELSDTIQLATQELSPHLVAFWLRDCASDFHAWYNAERLLVDDEDLRLARLRLADATRQVLANGLNLLGVSAPQNM